MRSRVFIVAVPTEMTIVVGRTATLLVKLYYKPWFTSKHKAAKGDVNVNSLSPSIAPIGPATIPIGHQDIASFIVSGGMVGGPAIIKVDGKSRHGDYEAVEVKVTVIAVGEDENQNESESESEEK
ncbi:MAG: hypothetical protein HOI47_07490 [Candidatus Scalindua sp.]|nr:hypothetical protein [Candidatus Scalindua sp.]